MNDTPHHTRASFAWSTFLTLASLALLAASLQAQVPTMISYQGRVQMNNTNFGGTGQFKFALVRGPGPALLWKNDGSAGNTEPAAAVTLSVANGLVMTTLGDTALANMTALSAATFEYPDVRLRVWFNGGAGFQQLTPDQRIVSVGYALMAGNVPDGSITSAKLAANSITSVQISDGTVTAADLAPNSVNTGHIIDGQVMTADLANNAVTSAKVADGSLLGADLANGTVGTAQLASSIALGATNVNGRLDVFRTSASTPSISLLGSSSQISTYGSDGLEQTRLWGVSYGELLLNNSLANNATAVRLSAQGSTGGQLELRNTNGVNRAVLEGENTGGALTLYQTDGGVGVFIDGDSGGAGLVSVRGTNGSTRATLDGSDGGGGAVRLYENDGTETVSLTSQGNGNMVLRQGDGSAGVGIYANNGTGGGGVTIYQDNGTFAGQLTVASATSHDGFLGLANSGGSTRLYARAGNPGGYMGLLNSGGTQTITLNAESGVEARLSVAGTVSGKVIEITGGSDFSEKFDIRGDALEPGMIVSIDPKHPGQLALCDSAHDKKVAGIVSGAGGVKPGMLMSQPGTKADGQYPVALTGRVYCWVDADANGAIEPGDMLTTSATLGHGMKVTDFARATGAIIGKAMTGLEKGKGLVLVLVNLQ